MPSEDQLLTRAQRLWAGLAKVPSDYPAENPTVLVSPDSGLCPPGWVGVVLLGGAALVTAPTEPVAERLRQAAGRLTPQALADPQALGAVLRPTEVLGPATLAYLAPEEFGPAHEHRAEELAPDHPALCALRDRATPAEADETDLADLTFAVLDDGRALAAAGYHRWPGGAAQLNVFTDPDHRSRGLARSAASAAVAHALAAGLLPQWRARPPASRRVAAALGFRELGAQLSLRLA
ncbi:GNAT family N-acetyltransferase [Kitasatospora azatica]|uniref:GNAT family N-acetyltransferase n=1 Tax=Kitasatospora azatica TaxID=58347 RepID=UPI00055B0495|nr:GNAT family N-acetyltransferase [Kitasatospora azatica]